MHFKSTILAVLAAFLGCTGSGKSAEIPFEFKNGLLWVKVATAGSTLNFVLDSGAGSSVLSLEAARRVGVKFDAPVSVQTVGSQASAYQVHGFSARVGGIPIKADLLAINLGPASAACGRPVDGLLGQDFFRHRVVQINFKTHRVRMLEAADASRACAVLPLRYHNDALCVPVGVNGLKPQWTRLDTGCDSSLEWAETVGPMRRGANTSLALASTSGKTILADVQLGSQRISGVRTGLHNQQLFAGEAGLLGSGLLSKFCVTIDSRKMRLLLER